MYFENPNSIELLLGKITFWDMSEVTDMSYLFMGAKPLMSVSYGIHHRLRIWDGCFGAQRHLTKRST